MVTSIGFEQLKLEPCYFIYRHPETGQEVHLIIHVDDQIIAGDKDLVAQVIAKMEDEFIMTQSELTSFLQIDYQFIEADNEFHLSQPGKIDELLAAYELSDCKISDTPLGSGLSYGECGKELDADVPYRSLVGRLNYAANSLRPDISLASSWLSRFVECPTTHHWKEGKRVIRYLKGTRNDGLRIKALSEKAHELTVYVDASFADKEDFKSTSGCIVMFDGTVLNWFSRKQTVAALSTTEAEYIAAGEGVREALYWSSVLKEIGLEFSTVVKTDSQSVLKILTKENLTPRTRHYGVIVVRVRDEVITGAMNLEYVPSKENLADIFTKPLQQPLFTELKSQITAEKPDRSIRGEC